MKARTLILTAGTTAALVVPVSQASARNTLHCSASLSTKAVQSDYNRRALLSASSCAKRSQPGHHVRISSPAISAPVEPLAPAAGTTVPASASTDGSFGDSYFDTSSIDPNAVSQTNATASTSSTPDLQDGYLAAGVSSAS